MKRVLWMILIGLFSSLALSLAVAQDNGSSSSSLDELPPGATAAAVPTRLARPAPVGRVDGGTASLEFYFFGLPQGETGMFRVTGDRISGVRARFLEKRTSLYFVPGDGWFGLLSTAMEQPSGIYALDIFVEYDDGSRSTINAQVEVVLGGFIRQDVVIPPEKGYLVSPEVERSELARLESQFEIATQKVYWDSSGFQMPVNSDLTSPFGAFRTFNATLNTRHTGWDIKTTLGAPILASAAGVVVFAGRTDIRGNYVMVDHGYGVFSGYAHMSQIHVTRGLEVAKGQVLGLVGDTGRTSGTHFHWEMAVNGEWVDSKQFIEMWMP